MRTITDRKIVLKRRQLLTGLLLSMGVASHALGAGGHMDAKPDGAVWLVGDSTLHSYTSRTTQLKVTGTLDSQSAASPGAPPFDSVLHRSALKTFEVVIPVTSLKSKDSGLDKNMYKALNADHCPDITFHLSSYAVSNDSASAKDFHAKVIGTLSVGCKEKPVTLETDLTAAPETLHATGQYALLMTDYGVKPPSFMMGMLTAKNSIVIHYDLQLTQAN